MRRPHHGHRQNATAYIAINTGLCEACWKCVSVCPKGVLGKVNFIFHKHVRIVNPKNCAGCLACEKACRAGAIISLKGSKLAPYYIF
ncbi:iron-sulfur cluster-binding protein [Desulfocucumis palustris]|uniref:Iron-sulfur cluster-binding protein n=1 Tax=Desulfocucumis palustris TaxID=1898651 RepID=A0A2L2XET9_9FIRM|nr:ferredoxin family protein [Desulfocucumis palustris]GBF34758.1 iron-sulfur cluster-binding protein [Desulfocucumis palustris]